MLQIIAFGGFGIPFQNESKKSLHHRRLCEITLTDLTTKKQRNLTPKDFKIPTSMYCTLVQQPTCGKKMEFVLFGGRSSPKAATNNTTIISLNAEECEITTLPNVDNIPAARWRHTANVVTQKGCNEHKMLVFGGRDEKNLLGDCWTFDMKALKWSEVALLLGDQNIITMRHSHSSALWSNGITNNLVISGGLDSNEKPLNDLIVVELLTNEEASITRWAVLFLYKVLLQKLTKINLFFQC